jgi:hypothetical protein
LFKYDLSSKNLTKNYEINEFLDHTLTKKLFLIQIMIIISSLFNNLKKIYILNIFLDI